MRQGVQTGDLRSVQLTEMATKTRNRTTVTDPLLAVDKHLHREPVDLDELLKSLSISEGTVRKDAIQQPRLMEQAARLNALCLAEKANAETALVIRKAEVAAVVRADMVAKGGKVTEAAVDQARRTSPLMTAAYQRAEKASERYEWSVRLLDAFSQRSKMIEVIGAK